MDEFEKVNKLWNEFEFKFDPVDKDFIKDLYKEITYLRAWNSAIENIFSTLLKELADIDQQELKKQMEELIDKNFYELSADVLTKWGQS